MCSCASIQHHFKTIHFLFKHIIRWSLTMQYRWDISWKPAEFRCKLHISVKSACHRDFLPGKSGDRACSLLPFAESVSALCRKGLGVYRERPECQTALLQNQEDQKTQWNLQDNFRGCDKLVTLQCLCQARLWWSPLLSVVHCLALTSCLTLLSLSLLSCKWGYNFAYLTSVLWSLSDSTRHQF